MGVMERVYCASIFTLAVVVMYMCVRCGFGSSVNRFFTKAKAISFARDEARQNERKGPGQSAARWSDRCASDVCDTFSVVQFRAVLRASFGRNAIFL